MTVGFLLLFLADSLKVTDDLEEEEVFEEEDSLFVTPDFVTFVSCILRSYHAKREMFVST